MLPLECLDRIHVAFDEYRPIANAGLLLPATMARHLGLGELVDNQVGLEMRQVGRMRGTRC